jgi:16S rRNA (cytosine1402-N4)-methyltransferase
MSNLAQERVLLPERLFRPRNTKMRGQRHVVDIDTMNEGHKSVLLGETLRLLEQGGLAGESPRVLDCTFGGGGHSRAILESFPNVKLTGIDTDPEAAPRAEQLAQDFPDRLTFIDSNFGRLAQLSLGGEFDAILFDLGVSSFHFDTPGRGFSFRFDAPLDMRLNPREGISAVEFLESASDEELVKAIRDYAEEVRWRAVIRAIKDARGSGRLGRTSTFAELVANAAGGMRQSRIHPATKTFQGIRIAVNREMQVIEDALPAAFSLLKRGGVLAVISFHSLEDRIVKRYFRREAGLPENREDSRPQQSRQKRAELLNSRPIEATPEELEANPRARSAKLRALKKL